MLQNQTCWFLATPDTRPELVVRRTGAIGDTLCATCVAIKLNEMGYRIRWQCHPDMHGMIGRVPSVASVEEPGRMQPHVDLDGAYESHPARKRVSFQDIFMVRAGDQLTQRRIILGAATNCAPVLELNDGERERTIAKWHGTYPRPWIVFAARSNSHANRTIPDGSLSAISKGVSGTCFWAANHAHAPEGFIDLGVRNLDSLIMCLSAADLFVGPDTGPMHIAAALKVPVIALEQASSPELHLSDQRDFLTVKRTDLACLNCQHVICPLPGKAQCPPCTEFSANPIINAINARIALQSKPTSVSCVVTVYKSPVERLNRCLNAVLPQVDEIVVTKDAGGIFPQGALRHPKIRYVSSHRINLGYGKNANHGVRHTTGRWILLLNDDCYLSADAVKHLLEVGMRDTKIGLVGNLTYYPDGRICHGGKIRPKGSRTWALVDNRRKEHTIRTPRRLENVSGTSVLVRREAFYAVNGFDEDFFLYAEDDAMNLALQEAGFQIWYTPYATGIHDEAVTNSKNFNMSELLTHANKTFENRWGKWLNEHRHRAFP